MWSFNPKTQTNPSRGTLKGTLLGFLASLQAATGSSFATPGPLLDAASAAEATVRDLVNPGSHKQSKGFRV